MKTKHSSFLTVAACLALVMTSPVSLQATILTVTSTADSGAGTLRGALGFAGDGDSIDATGVSGTITLTNGELSVPHSVTILGPGASILAVSGNDSNRVFNIAVGTTVHISGLTIRDGRAANGGTGVAGEPGGGIYNAGALTLSDCVVTNNRTGNGGPGSNGTGDGGPGATGGAGGGGGGIYNASTGVLSLNRCTISGNASGAGGQGGTGARGSDSTSTGHRGGPGGAGGAGGAGAGVFSDGQVTNNDCTIVANNNGSGGVGGRGGNGGDCTGIIPLHWGGDGGSGGVGGVGGSGGGVCGRGITLQSNCIISGNGDGPGGHGGTGGNGGSGSTTGHGGAGGNGGNGGSGSGAYNSDTMVLVNCTLASGATGAGGGGGPVGSGTSRESAGTAGAGGNGGAIFNDGYSGNALLTVDDCTVSNNVATFNGGGIYNYGVQSVGATLSASNCLITHNWATNWGGGLYNDGGNSGGNATLMLNACTISNNWAAADGGGVLNNGNYSGHATATLTNCLIYGNQASLGGGLHNDGYSGNATNIIQASTISGNSANLGGGIYSEGGASSNMTVAIYGSTLTGNAASTNGGAIYNDDAQGNGAITVTITNCLITDNWATNWGGGIFNNSLSANAMVTLSGSTVSNNTASASGGGIFNYGTQSDTNVLDIAGSVLIGNSAGNFGGGIFNTNAAVTVTDSMLTDNSAQIGGAVLNSGNLAVLNSQFADNVAQGTPGQTPGVGSNGGAGGGGAGMGGAIFSDGPVLTLTDSVFSGNSAIGGHGGDGINNSTNNPGDPGGNGGGPYGGLGGAVGQAGDAGGYGSGGGGGAGSATNGYAGGAAGFGGGGGGGGARGDGDSGGLGGLGGDYAGNGANALYSGSGGGGGGAGLGGAVFVREGAVSVVSCTFTGNLATNGLGGASYYNVSGQGVGGALFSTTTNVLTQNIVFSNNAASTFAPDLNLPFLVVTLADDGPGSLRQVLTSATNGAAITFFVSGTIALTNGPLNVASNVTLLGPGPGALIVSGNNTTNVFNVTGTNVTISGLTIANGYSSTGAGGAGINAAASSGSRITLNNCVVTNNNNTAYDGGGIYNSPGVTMVLSNCAVCGNSASNTFGGGICNRQGVLNIVDSTLSGNAGFRGGAIYNDGGSSNATLTIANSTLSGNTAANWGGAVFNDGSSSPATNKINSSTFSGNSASQGGAIYNYGAASRAEIGDTIFNVGAGSGGTLYNPSGTIKSDGYNLSSDAAGGDGSTGPGGLLNSTNDIRNTDPMLGPLQDNGGWTWTHALLSGSPAVDKGKRNAVTNLVSTTDQRGFARSVDFASIPNAAGGDSSDIGAFEIQYNPVVLSTADSGLGTLRDAVVGVTNGATITFDPSLSGQTITLTNGQIALGKNVTIDGSALPGGITINGNHASRIFQVGGGPVVLNSLTITNGIDTGGGNQGGGGILNYGTLTLNNCTLAGNSAQSTNWGGGGILSYNGALTVNQSTVSGNSANAGGGGIIIYGGTLTLLSSTLSGNSAPSGGGIYNSVGSATIRNTILNAGASGINLSNLLGTITSYGYNLSSDNSGIGFLTATGDQNNTDPQLGPLQDNGGPTWTHALLPGSPAIDAGDDSLLALLPTDQRGFPRKSGAHVDIGAVELQVIIPGNPPILTGMERLGNGGFQFSFTNTPGASFTVFTATNLALPFSDWTVLGAPIEIAPGQFQFTDAQAINSPQRFYRVRSP